MTTSDPHRRAGCRWVKGDNTWLSQLDWAVYHAPGWERWQEFRKRLVGRSSADKLAKLRAWPTNTPQDVLRVMNYCRSMRGQWATEPGFKTLATELRARYEKGKKP